MEIFRLHDSSYKPINSVINMQELTWVERYQSAGEFKLVVEGDIDILTKLPLGCIISHTDTREVMLVENHEVERTSEKKLLTTITGRSLETFAENRVTAGSEQAQFYPDDTAITEEIGPGVPSALARDLFLYRVSNGTEEEDSWLNTTVTTDMRATETSISLFTLQRGDVYSRLIELLKMSDAGIKNSRPVEGTTLDVVIHDGADRTASIHFHAQNQDLTDAQYFWSVKDLKHYIWVAGKYANRVVMELGMTNYLELWGRDRRYMYLDANDLESDYSTGTIPDDVRVRGQAELQFHNQLGLMQATVSETANPKFKYDYDVGDLVTVHGEFGVAQVMRVTEHILTVDKQGMRGYPTLLMY